MGQFSRFLLLLLMRKFHFQLSTLSPLVLAKHLQSRLLIKLAEFLDYGVIGDHNYLFTLCACMFCLHRTCTSYVHEKDLSFLETEATSHREPPCGCWESSWNPLEEQLMLTSEPSSQLPRS